MTSSAGRIERWDAAEAHSPKGRESERIRAVVLATHEIPLETAFVPRHDEILESHAEDLLRHLREWSTDLDAREAALNAREALLEHRERSLRLWSVDLKRLQKEREHQQRIRGEVLSSHRFDPS
jgi:hypothetical protein